MMTTTTTTNPYAPPRAAVRDIADASLPHTLADRGTRLGAAILDGLIFAAMVYVPMLVVFMVGAAASGPDARENAGTFFGAGFIVALAGLVAWCWLTILYVKRNGQSIAKKLLGIKVVRTDGSPASLGRIFWLRNFVNGLISILPLYGLVDVLFIFGESQQCLHDKIADTIVIKA